MGVQVSLDAPILKSGMTLHNVIAAPEFGMENAVKITSDRSLLNKMFRNISEDEREIWELKSRGYTYREIADFCNISISKASNRMYKIRKQLLTAFPNVYSA